METITDLIPPSEMESSSFEMQDSIYFFPNQSPKSTWKFIYNVYGFYFSMAVNVYNF